MILETRSEQKFKTKVKKIFEKLSFLIHLNESSETVLVYLINKMFYRISLLAVFILSFSNSLFIYALKIWLWRDKMKPLSFTAVFRLRKRSDAASQCQLQSGLTHAQTFSVLWKSVCTDVCMLWSKWLNYYNHSWFWTDLKSLFLCQKNGRT